MRVGIALGSNLGNRLAHLRAAAAAIRSLAEAPVLASRIYETAPVDCPPDSPTFLNAAMEIGFSGNLRDLLAQLQAIEQNHDRPALHDRNAPRTVDLDILYADDLVVNDGELTVPHPRLMDRMFVLAPLCDIVPLRRLIGGNESFLDRRNRLERTNQQTTDTLDVTSDELLSSVYPQLQ